MQQKQFPGMDIAASLMAKLDQIDTRQVNGSSRVIATVDFDGGSFVCELGAIDKLACMVHEITIQSDRTEALTSEQLSSMSDDLASRLSYLLEPVSTIEFDQEATVLQMRSSPPSQNESEGGKTCSYFEILARPREILMVRYQKQPGEPRQRASMTFTREVIGRIASDMLATIQTI